MMTIVVGHFFLRPKKQPKGPRRRQYQGEELLLNYIPYIQGSFPRRLFRAANGWVESELGMNTLLSWPISDDSSLLYVVYLYLGRPFVVEAD